MVEPIGDQENYDRSSQSIYQRITNFAKNDLPYSAVISAAEVSVSLPIMAAFERFFANIPQDQSIDARILGAAMTFAGFGKVLDKMRNRARYKYNVTDESPEGKQYVVDTGTKIVYNGFRFPTVYFIVGVRNISKIAGLTGLGVLHSLYSGYLSGIALDVYKDLAGFEESKRLPNFIAKRSKKAKKVMLAGSIAASLLLTTGIYKTANLIQGTENTADLIEENSTEVKHTLDDIIKLHDT